MSHTPGSVIRDADLPDWEAVNAIHKAAYPQDRYTYANNIGARGAINLVAAIEGRIVGFITVLVDQPNPAGKSLWERVRPYIGFVGVAEESRRSGVARALVIAASRRALLETRRDHIFLECEMENGAAQNFYEKLGFESVAEAEVEYLFGRPPHPQSIVYRAEKQVLGL